MSKDIKLTEEQVKAMNNAYNEAVRKDIIFGLDGAFGFKLGYMYAVDSYFKEQDGFEYCPYCGLKLGYKVTTDVNSGIECKNKFCKGIKKD